MIDPILSGRGSSAGVGMGSTGDSAAVESRSASAQALFSIHVLVVPRVVLRSPLGLGGLARSRLESLLDRLLADGYRFATFDRYWEAAQNGGGTSDERTLILSFDGATVEFAELVLPVLERRAIPSVLFCTTGKVGRRERTAGLIRIRREQDHLGWGELKHLIARGVSVQSRGHTLADLRRFPPEIAFGDLLRSRRELEHRLDHEAMAVAYPLAAVDDSIEELAARAGFGLGFVSGKGRGDSRLRRPRIPLRPTDSPERLLRRIKRARERG